MREVGFSRNAKLANGVLKAARPYRGRRLRSMSETKPRRDGTLRHRAVTPRARRTTIGWLESIGCSRLLSCPCTAAAVSTRPKRAVSRRDKGRLAAAFPSIHKLSPRLTWTRRCRGLKNKKPTFERTPVRSQQETSARRMRLSGCRGIT